MCEGPQPPGTLQRGGKKIFSFLPGGAQGAGAGVQARLPIRIAWGGFRFWGVFVFFLLQKQCFYIFGDLS